MTEPYGAGLSRPGSSVERVLDAVQSAGLRHKVSHGGHHIQAECPAHTDANPSLSIDFKPNDGRTLLNCQAGCPIDDIVAALDLTAPMLYDDFLPPHEFAERRAQEREQERRTGRRTQRKATSRAAKPRPTLPKGRLPSRIAKPSPRPLGDWTVTTQYDYCDATAEVIHQEVRHQRPVEVLDESGRPTQKIEKRFTQRWPDGNGGWVDKTPAGFVPVLYRFPDVIEWIAEGRPIWLCEGAKDADRFIDEHDQAATTNPSGATNFKAEQAAALAGAHVIAVIDHDAAGYQRGIKLAEILDQVASLRLVLPATAGRHQDASDHFDAGHGLGDFVDVTVEQLRVLAQVAAAEDAAAAAADAAAEAIARSERAGASKGARKSDETRFAGRWAAEAGKLLVRATGALEEAGRLGGVQTEYRDRLIGAVLEAQASVRVAHEAAEVEIPTELTVYLQAPELEDGEGHTADEELDEHEADVIEHPATSKLPPPGSPLPSTRGMWAFEEGGQGRRARGVYMATDSRWERIAPLPYVHARIVRRDGGGRRTGTFYLVSATENDQAVLIGHDEIRTSSWANLLGLPIAQEDKILRAATSALVFHAEDAPEVEATPRVVDGKVSLPRPETMPSGYLTPSGLSRAEALEVWRQIVTLAAENPRMALVLGAAAISPFIGGLRQQPHVLAIYGDPMQGKTTTLAAAAAMWGYPGGEDGAGVLLSWNATTLSVPAFLGDLGVLPAFMDEIGQAGDMRDGQWHQLISNITQGAVRMTRSRNKPGVQLGLSWRGIFFSSGNAPMGHGASGKNSGVPRRMVELSTPFTNSAEHGEAIEDLVPKAYGHVGLEILDKHSIETVRPLVDQAAEAIGGGFQTPHERAMAEHVTAHLAGAQILDELCGTGGLLFNAALLAAAEFLDEQAPPPHDADRVLEELADWIAREPGAWPTREQYLALKRPKGFDEDLPLHGFRGEFAGYIEDDGTVMVTHSAWKAMVKELEVSAKVALRTLDERGLLKTQESRRRRGEWSIQSRVMGSTVYAITLPEPEDDEAPEARCIDPTISGPSNPSVGGVGGPGGGSVGGDDVPLTCGVGGVGGVGGSASRTHAPAREIHFPGSGQAAEASSGSPEIVKLGLPEPCVVCGTPAGQRVDGTVIHLGECMAGFDASETATAIAVQAEPDEQLALEEPAGDIPSPAVEDQDEQAPTARWQFPVVALDEQRIYLPGGGQAEWPEYRHLGDLAMLAHRDRLRLGHGGGETLPEAGQIWITSPAAMERLGLPARLELDQDVSELDAEQSRQVVRKALRTLDELPVITAAIDEGWEIGRGSDAGHLDSWTFLKHPDLLPGGVRLVLMPYSRLLDVPLIAKSSSAAELADNLADAAHTFGVQFVVHPGITAHNLINHTRPPRADEHSLSGSNASRVALVRNTKSELPPFLRNAHDSRTKRIEEDYSWWRPWDSLLSHERDLPYVHAYDRNGSYLAEWETLDLGVDGLVHAEGADAHWDGKERAGYWLIERDWGEWPEPMLPPPGLAAVVEEGRVWVTTPTLLALRKLGIEPTVVESYTWSTNTRYLSQSAKVLKAARASENAAVTATAKAMYAVGSGRFARESGLHSFDHLWRPDWFHHIKASARFKIQLTLMTAAAGGTYPVAVARDSIVFLSDEPDPVKAWPGRENQIDPIKAGFWKPEASGLSAQWGPEHLPTRQSGRLYWRHLAAMEALTSHKAGTSAWQQILEDGEAR